MEQTQEKKPKKIKVKNKNIMIIYSYSNLSHQSSGPFIQLTPKQL